MKLKKILTGVPAAGLCAANLASIPASAYGGTAAVVYAQRWAKSRNPVYYNFGWDENDCTNFVSQCVACGRSMSGSGTGEPTLWSQTWIEDNQYKWYMSNKIHRTVGYDYWRLSRSWSCVTEFRNYFGSHGSVTYVNRNSTSWYSSLQMGDIVQAGNTGYGHSVIVVSPSSSNPLFCGHTRDAYYDPMTMMRDYAKAGGRQMYIVRPS